MVEEKLQRNPSRNAFVSYKTFEKTEMAYSEEVETSSHRSRSSIKVRRRMGKATLQLTAATLIALELSANLQLQPPTVFATASSHDQLSAEANRLGTTAAACLRAGAVSAAPPCQPNSGSPWIAQYQHETEECHA